MKGIGENNPDRAYNTWAENQRIKETVRVAKRQGNGEILVNNLSINEGKAYNSWAENQRIKETVKVAKEELGRDEAKEVLDWLAVIRLPETIRNFLSRKLWILLPIYDLLILFLYYKLTLYMNEAFGYSEKIMWLFNSPYKLTGNEIIGHLFYLGIFGLPMLYPIVIEIEFIFYLIKDIIRIIKRIFIKDNINLKEEIENHKIEPKDLDNSDGIKINFKSVKEIKTVENKNKVEESEEQYESLFKEEN